jgi:hypothetical protein
LGESLPFQVAGSRATHGSPYAYDRHVPLLFFGSAFRPGQYRTAVQPVDMIATLASLLEVNPPAAAQGRVLTEAIEPHIEHPQIEHPQATGAGR